MSTNRTEQDPAVAPTLSLLGDADGVLCTGDACVLPPPQPDDAPPSSRTERARAAGPGGRRTTA